MYPITTPTAATDIVVRNFRRFVIPTHLGNAKNVHYRITNGNTFNKTILHADSSIDGLSFPSVHVYSYGSYLRPFDVRADGTFSIAADALWTTGTQEIMQIATVNTLTTYKNIVEFVSTTNETISNNAQRWRFVRFSAVNTGSGTASGTTTSTETFLTLQNVGNNQLLVWQTEEKLNPQGDTRYPSYFTTMPPNQITRSINRETFPMKDPIMTEEPVNMANLPQIRIIMDWNNGTIMSLLAKTDDVNAPLNSDGTMKDRFKASSGDDRWVPTMIRRAPVNANDGPRRYRIQNYDPRSRSFQLKEAESDRWIIVYGGQLQLWISPSGLEEIGRFRFLTAPDEPNKSYLQWFPTSNRSNLVSPNTVIFPALPNPFSSNISIGIAILSLTNPVPVSNTLGSFRFIIST